MSRKRVRDALPNTSPPDINNPAPYTTQWWYYKMLKKHNEARLGYVDTQMTYNPLQARIKLKCVVFTRESLNFCHPSVRDT